MKYLLAQLVDEQAPYVLARESPPPPDPDNPTRISAPGALRYSALCACLRAGDLAGWLEELRREGEMRASAGVEAPALIAEGQRLMKIVREAVLRDLPPHGAETLALAQEIDALETNMLGALVSGYFEGQERQANDQRLALEELSALFKINSAANSTLDF